MAAAPRITIKATPIRRPEELFLLQPWSTAASQTQNRTMAMTPTDLSSIEPLRQQVMPLKPLKKGQRSQADVNQKNT
jgi:hypothetical protein